MHDSLAIKAPIGPETLSHAALANTAVTLVSQAAVTQPIATQPAEGSNAALALALMRSLPESIYLVSAEGRVIFANGPGFARLGQASGQGSGPQAVHRNWLELWPDADSQPLTMAFAAALDGDTSRLSVISRDDQRKGGCDLTIAPVEDGSGVISRVLCIACSTGETA